MTTKTAESHLPRRLGITLCLLLAAPALSDSVWLKNGNRLEGSATTLSSGEVEIHSAAGTLRLPAALVDRVESGQTLEGLAREELARLAPEDTGGRLALAERLDAAGAATLARAVVEQVVQLDPANERARRRLGHIDCDGRWLTEQECHAHRGEVFYRGRWIDASEWAALEALEVRRRVAANELRHQEARLESLRLESERDRGPGYAAGYGHPHYWGWPGGVAVVPVPDPPAAPPPVFAPSPVPRPPAAPPRTAGQSRRSSFQAPAGTGSRGGGTARPR